MTEQFKNQVGATLIELSMEMAKEEEYFLEQRDTDKAKEIIDLRDKIIQLLNYLDE